jgi:hypothetical protein
MALTKEDGSTVADANTYVDRADVDAYHAARLTAAAWAALTSDVKDASILAAAELMDASFSWRGEIASDAQAMRWPRKCVKDRDGRAIAVDAIPTQIQKAQSELALLLATGSGVGGSFGSTATAGGALQRVKAGTVEVEFRAGQVSASPAMASNVLPDGAGELLDRFLVGLYDSPAGPMIALGKS